MKLSIGNMRTIYLASQSPRRRELMGNLGIPFEICESGEEGKIEFNGDPGEFVLRLAKEKSQEPLKAIDSGIVITADTIVYINGEILEKPSGRADAVSMLEKLHGKTHQVYTGLCVSAKPEDICLKGYEATDVTFSPMSSAEIEWYVNSGEYRDKAGAYAIQECASIFVKNIHGCYFNVVGLPLNRLYNLLMEMNSLLTK
ncbi:Maf family protein [candidate division KSB1 bacterium]